jgi:hypothetical protein
MLKKKSQISIFIIIALILIVVSVFLFSNKDYEIFLSKNEKLKNQIVDVVNTCIEKKLKEAVFKLSFQGGFIEIPQKVKSDPRYYIDIGFVIPNWNYENQNDLPTIESMEEEINNYVRNNAYSCITSDLKGFKDFLDINVSKEFDVKSKINKENVEIEANLPIKFKEKNSNEVLTISDYYVKLDPLRLGAMFELANKIYKKEVQSKFLESLVIEQILSSNDYSSKESMPGEGIFFTCTPRFWTISQLKNNLANLNNNNFRYLYFKGTYERDLDFIKNVNLDENSKKYFESSNIGYVQDLGLDDYYKNYKVSAFFPSSEITGENGYFKSYPFRKFEVTPSNGEIVKPLKMNFGVSSSKFLKVPCVQVYHHLYDLDYDLIFKIEDKSEDGNNFFFQFPINIKIQNNQPKYGGNFIPQISEQKTVNYNKYCSNESKKYPVDVVVLDGVSGDYLSNVNISYSCLSYTCDMGITKKPTYNGYIRQGAVPSLNEKFPFCFNGKLIAEKDGYTKGEIRIDTNENLLNRNTIFSPQIEIVPTKKFNFDKENFLAIDLDTKKGKRIYSENDGQVYIYFENLKYNFEDFILFNGNKDEDLEEFSNLELINVPGGVNYNISIFYMDKDENLKGLVYLENYLMDSTLGNEIEFVIPIVSSKIDENNFENYFDTVDYLFNKDKSLSNPFGIKIK